MCESSIYINARPQGFPAEHRIITVIPLVSNPEAYIAPLVHDLSQTFHRLVTFLSFV